MTKQLTGLWHVWGIQNVQYKGALWRDLWERKELRGIARCRWEITNNREVTDWIYPFDNRNESFAVVKAVMNVVSLLGCDAASLGIW